MGQAECVGRHEAAQYAVRVQRHSWGKHDVWKRHEAAQYAVRVQWHASHPLEGRMGWWFGERHEPLAIVLGSACDNTGKALSAFRLGWDTGREPASCGTHCCSRLSTRRIGGLPGVPCDRR